MHLESGDNTELTKTSSRDQATVTLIRLAVSTNRSHTFPRARSSHATEAHLGGTRLSPAVATVDLHFQTHPESNPPDKDIPGPGLQGGKHDLFSLSLKFVLREWVAVEV